MELIDKYLGEAKDSGYLHVIEDSGEFDVVHTVHDHPRMGGQQLRSFKDRKKAVQWALKTKKKNEIVITWKKVGQGYRAEWLRGGTYTKLV